MRLSGALTGKASPAAAWGVEVSASSPTANEVASSEEGSAVPPLLGGAGDMAKISTVTVSFMKSSVSLSCAGSSFAVGRAVLAPGKACECTTPFTAPASADLTPGMWQSAHCCCLGGREKQPPPKPEHPPPSHLSHAV